MSVSVRELIAELDTVIDDFDRRSTDGDLDTILSRLADLTADVDEAFSCQAKRLAARASQAAGTSERDITSVLARDIRRNLIRRFSKQESFSSR